MGSDTATRIAWGLLALVHIPPLVVLLNPASIPHLYGASLDGPARVLLVHRGALFGAVVALCLFALWDPAVRRAASMAVGVSMVSFLTLYLQSGLPAGPLRRVAVVDAAAVLPLLWVTANAWIR
ncbi:MAG: hypothetical protein AAFZ18_16385 [Myxococcota bacterium]